MSNRGAMKKSIIIAVHNQHEFSDIAILAVLEHTEDCEIIVIDNGSEPAFKPPFSGFIETKLIRNETNLGFPVAVNQGVRAATGDVIILLNNDVIVTPEWAERFKNHLNNYSIVGPLTNYSAGMQRAQISDYENKDDLYKEAAHLSDECDGEAEEVSFVIGFCMAFKRSLYDDIGPFDESLWPCSGEEIDFCFRARDAGHKIGIANDVYVHHEGSQTFKAIDVNYDEICKRNDAHLAEKWGADFWGRQAVAPTCEGVRLNMGCGPFPMQGFTNIDQFEAVNPDLVCDVTALPYEPGTVSEIYAGHILEHFRFDEGKKVLRYWLTLLKPGGLISVVVPDYDFLVKEYVKDMTPERLIEFNDTYIYSGIQPSPHQYAYSAALLEKVMKETGFANIERMPVNHPYFPFAVDWQCGFQGVRP